MRRNLIPVIGAKVTSLCVKGSRVPGRACRAICRPGSAPSARSLHPGARKKAARASERCPERVAFRRETGCCRALRTRSPRACFGRVGRLLPHQVSAGFEHSRPQVWADGDRTLVPIWDGASRCARTTTAIVHIRSSVVAEWRAMLMQTAPGGSLRSIDDRFVAKLSRAVAWQTLAVADVEALARWCPAIAALRESPASRSLPEPACPLRRCPGTGAWGHDDGWGVAPGRRRCGHDNSRAYKIVREIDMGVGQSALLDGRYI